MRCGLIVACVISTAGIATAQAPDAARVVADMRQALGGDAAIAAVQSFSVSGSESHSAGGHSGGADIELLCVLPDRFLRVRRVSSPFGMTTEEYGFNGNDRIRRRDSDMPYPPDPGENDPPPQKAQREARTLANTKRDFARLTIAMIGIPSIEPLDVSYAGQLAVDGRNVDVLVLRAVDGYEAKLFVDLATHLPWMISWMGTPIVTATSTSVVAVPRGQMPDRLPTPSFAPMPDPLTLPPVEHQLFFAEYKLADGLTWPHKLTEKVGGREYSTTKLGKFKLNPRIDSRRFDPARR